MQAPASTCAPARPAILWLQTITLLWMLVECAVSAYAAVTAHKPRPARLRLRQPRRAPLRHRRPPPVDPALLPLRTHGRATASVLLYALACIVAVIAILSVLLKRPPETSVPGIAITVAALIAMPVLALLKRREARRTGNVALAADAVQSATCAWLAAITLAGLASTPSSTSPGFDSLAALAATPLLVKEARAAAGIRKAPPGRRGLFSFLL